MNPLKIISILVKPVQIALLVAGMGSVAYFTKEYHDDLTKRDPIIDPYDVGVFGRNEFFLFSTGVGVGIAVLGLVGTLIGLLETKHGAFGACIAQAIWTLQLLISTALVAKILATYKKEIAGGLSTCEALDKLENRDYDYNCDQLTGGVVSGFLAMIVFAVDTVISLISYTKASK